MTTIAAYGIRPKAEQRRSRTEKRVMGIEAFFLRDKVYCYEKFVAGKRKYIAYNPQPTPPEVIVVNRYYTSLKSNHDIRKRVTWIDDNHENRSSHLVVVEYLGEGITKLPHGNAKKKTEPYIRTAQKTLDAIS